MDGVEQDTGPRPVAVEVKSSAVGGDAGGDVEEAVSDRLGGGAAQLPDTADALGAVRVSGLDRGEE
jgi:hypothetical protein